MFQTLEFLSFRFISSFDIRISDLDWKFGFSRAAREFRGHENGSGDCLTKTQITAKTVR